MNTSRILIGPPAFSLISLRLAPARRIISVNLPVTSTGPRPSIWLPHLLAAHHFRSSPRLTVVPQLGAGNVPEVPQHICGTFWRAPVPALRPHRRRVKTRRDY